jgi:hypothetical protein
MKNIKDYQSFIFELKKFEYDYKVNDDIIKDYEYTKDEVVTLKHPSWKEEYDFVVITPGKTPTLKQCDGNGVREIVLDNPRHYEYIMPAKLKNEYKEKTKPVKTPKLSKEKMISEKEYKEICQSIATSGLDDRNGEPYNHSELMDMALDQVQSDKKLRNYLSKRLMDNDSYRWDEYDSPSDFDCAEEMANDLASYN